MSLRAITAPAPCGIGWSRHLGHVGSEREDGVMAVRMLAYVARETPSRWVTPVRLAP
jgi:hypothetical protein